MAKRIIKPGVVYYIETTTKDCIERLSDPHWARFLLLSMGYHRYMLNYRMYAYLIMPDSFYLMVQPSTMYTISKIMKLIKGNFARKYNEYKKRSGTVWSQSFIGEIIKDKETFQERLDYIHFLPVRSKLVKDARDYEFSSYNNYSMARRTTIQLVIDSLPEKFTSKK